MQKNWKFKNCLYKKTIIKNSQYQMLKNGDIVIMQREDQIGFETKKKTSGRSSKPPKWFKDFVDNDFKPLVKKVDSVIKLNNLKTK